jgi:hypothetical protein
MEDDATECEEPDQERNESKDHKNDQGSGRAFAVDVVTYDRCGAVVVGM